MLVAALDSTGQLSAPRKDLIQPTAGAPSKAPVGAAGSRVGARRGFQDDPDELPAPPHPRSKTGRTAFPCESAHERPR